MKIALISPEFQSLVRRTNLAGVAESLGRALHTARQEVRVFLPWTRDVETAELGEVVPRAEVRVPDGTMSQTFRVVEGHLDGLTVYLFDNEPFFGTQVMDGVLVPIWRGTSCRRGPKGCS